MDPLTSRGGLTGGHIRGLSGEQASGKPDLKTLLQTDVSSLRQTLLAAGPKGQKVADSQAFEGTMATFQPGKPHIMSTLLPTATRLPPTQTQTTMARGTMVGTIQGFNPHMTISPQEYGGVMEEDENEEAKKQPGMQSFKLDSYRGPSWDDLF